MKKLLSILTAIALALSVTSCTDANSLSFEYHFNIAGDATGTVEVTMPGGNLSLSGETNLLFDWGSAPTFVLRDEAYTTFTTQELQSSTKKTFTKVGYTIENDYENAFSATATTGTYYLHITGVVREKVTGVEVKIDKVLTNREE